jgi:hypothetical protein
MQISQLLDHENLGGKVNFKEPWQELEIDGYSIQSSAYSKKYEYLESISRQLLGKSNTVLIEFYFKKNETILCVKAVGQTCTNIHCPCKICNLPTPNTGTCNEIAD